RLTNTANARVKARPAELFTEHDVRSTRNGGSRRRYGRLIGIVVPCNHGGAAIVDRDGRKLEKAPVARLPHHTAGDVAKRSTGADYTEMNVGFVHLRVGESGRGGEGVECLGHVDVPIVTVAGGIAGQRSPIPDNVNTPRV